MSYTHGLLVHFKEDIHDEDIGGIERAIEMIKWVTRVERIPASPDTALATERAKLDIRTKIRELL